MFYFAKPQTCLTVLTQIDKVIGNCSSEQSKLKLIPAHNFLEKACCTYVFATVLEVE